MKNATVIGINTMQHVLLTNQQEVTEERVPIPGGIYEVVDIFRYEDYNTWIVPFTTPTILFISFAALL